MTKETSLRNTGLWLLKPCTRKLSGFLSHQNIQLRNESAKALGLIGDAETIVPLTDCLFREKQDPAIPAALAEFKNQDALNALLQAFKEAESEIKPNLALALGSYKTKAVVEALKEGLNDIDPNVRFNCISALAQIKDNSSVSNLLACLGESNEWIFLNVINTLAQIGDHKATSTLTEFYAKERNERKRSVIVAALGQIGDLTAVPTLVRALRDDDDRVKANAIESLSRLGIPNEKLLSLVLPFIKHSNNRVRGNAILAAEKPGSYDLTPTLLDMKNDPNKWTRATLAFVLHKIDHAKSLSLIIELLRDHDKTVRKNAAYALSKKAKEAQSEIIIKLLDDEIADVRLQGIAIIGKLRIKSAAEWLVRLFKKDSNPSIRSAIVASLGEIGTKFDVPILVEALKDRNPRVRANAVESLEILLGEKAIPYLKPILKDPDNRTKANAAKALFALGDIDVTNNLEIGRAHV